MDVSVIRGLYKVKRYVLCLWSVKADQFSIIGPQNYIKECGLVILKVYYALSRLLSEPPVPPAAVIKAETVVSDVA